MINWQHFLNRTGKATLIIILIALTISLLTWWGRGSLTKSLVFDWEMISQGQVWRLISPIFIHYLTLGMPLQLIFYTMWLWDIGGIIEKRKSPEYLLSLVLLLGVLGNLCQYGLNLAYYGEGLADLRMFPSLSSVVYGIYAFVLARSKFDPFFGIRLNPAILQLMLLWLGLDLLLSMNGNFKFDLIVGLLLGAGLGYLTAKTKRF